MTQEQKDLLLKDLSARLPYGVKLSYKCNHIHILKAIHESGLVVINDIVTNVVTTTDVENIKPYLFPMSSMTEEQRQEWRSLMIQDSYGILYPTIKSFDYLYKNHIDVRELISLGLAIDATNLNIY